MPVDNLRPDRAHELLGATTDAATCVVEGREIPRLRVIERGEDIAFILDRRFSIDVPRHLAPSVAWMIANALAIGEGYPHMGAESRDMPFAPKVVSLAAPPAGADAGEVKPFPSQRDPNANK